jgi:hypothetical protein
MRIRLPLDRPRLVLRVLGWVGVLFSLYGLSTDKLMLSTYPVSQQPAELRTVYYTMAGADIAILMATFFVAAGLTRGLPRLVPVFVALQLLVLLVFLVPALLGSIPRFGRAIANAPPLYSGGTGLFIVTLYPFWGSLAAVWAAHRTGKGQASVPS